jgi:hypothetical protein
MASKKLKKLLAAGLAGYAGAKMLGVGAKGSAAANVNSGRGGSSASAMARKVANKARYKDSIMSGGVGTKAGSIGMGQKIKNFLTKEVINIPKTPGSENFGLGAMDGAKAGKMIKARGGKMVNLKPTKLY